MLGICSFIETETQVMLSHNLCDDSISTGIDEIVAEAKKVHIIDLGIKCGVQWTILMQALASRHECPLELLKIIFVGFTSSHTEVQGKRLMGFAQTMNLPFSFKVVIISDILDLKEDQFELDTEETVSIYSEFFIFNLIAQPDRLDYLMGVIRNMNPCIMVVIEVEANINSPAFVSRFVEGIRSAAVADGNEWRAHHIKIDIWRAFFSRFRMEEKDLSISMSSLYRLRLLLPNVLNTAMIRSLSPIPIFLFQNRPSLRRISKSSEEELIFVRRLSASFLRAHSVSSNFSLCGGDMINFIDFSLVFGMLEIKN
ncbi:DELLA protein 1-like [Tripterygium wilfordii]|uniref:DELLA protein 1-like n=1 Tax=Tripterygium wilfordii TaxID=458696 RepID=UPI0018F859D2|nr:DELLA protein 1-like [Tripterygium wilfordii]